MESTTLHFDNARAAAALYHNDERLLREMEQELGVQVASREGWIRIEGEKDKLDQASLIFTQLDEARRRGAAIGREEFRYALRGAAAGGENGSVTELAASALSARPASPPLPRKRRGNATMCAPSVSRMWSLASDRPAPEKPISPWPWPWPR